MPYNANIMTTEHLLQHCQLHDALRRDVARTDTTEGQAQCQPRGVEEDSRFREGDRHLHLAHMYNDDEEEEGSAHGAMSQLKKLGIRIIVPLLAHILMSAVSR